MKKLIPSLMLMATAAMPTWAENLNDTPAGTDAEEPAGFLTSMINNAMLKAMPEAPAAAADEKPEYGRTVTKWASAPKIGGYAIGTYKYSDEDKKHDGDGFASRNIRLYIDGTILNDFKYRVQFEFSGTPHVKDYFLSWSHWKELEVKVGQFKRCFTFENPYNPWDVGVGDYSQLTKKLAGMDDYSGADPKSNGGRDIGLQLQGDVLPVGQDKHRLFHYQVAVYNGQGINTKDANAHKDFIGTFQVQPIKDLYIGFFGWKGNVNSDVKIGDKTYNVTVNRNRYALGAKYEHNGWSARAEYAHSTGYKANGYNPANQTFNGNGRADAWYATVGVPCTPWLKVYAKYDAYRETAKNGSLNTIYSICPNFQLHKNLQLQVQYNFVNNKTAADRHHNELWAQAYFRF